MKTRILLLLTICAFLASCSSTSSSPSSSEANDFQTPDPNIYGGKSIKDFSVMWYNYGNRHVAYIEEIHPAKTDTALWNIKVSIVKSILKDFYTLSVPGQNITGQGIHVGDVVEYNRLDGISDLRKVTAYIQYLPKIKREDYDPQKMDPAYGGKGLNDLVPKYQSYDWNCNPGHNFSDNFGYARIVKIEIPDLGLWKIYLEGPNGYKTVLERTKDAAYNQRYYIGTVVQLEFSNRKLNHIISDFKAYVVPLTTPAEYNAFLHGGNPNDPLVVVNGKTAEQAMADGTFDIFQYVPDESGDE